MIQHRECGVRLKYRADPEDTEGAGSDHGAYRRVERMTAAAQDARWDLIQIADRLKEQDAQDAHGGVLDHGGLRCEQAGESIAERTIVKIGIELQSVDSPTWEDFAIMAMVERGMGVGILPDMILRRIPYRLEIRPLKEPYYRSIGLAMKHAAHLTPAARKFIDYLPFREADRS